MNKSIPFIVFILMNLSSLVAQQFDFTVQSGHTGLVKNLVFSDNSAFIASSGYDKKTIVWDLKSNKQLLSVVTSKPCKQIFFVQSDSFLITVEDNIVSKWSISSGNIIQSYSGSISNCFSLSINELIVTEGSSASVIDCKTFEKKYSFKLPNQFSKVLLTKDKLLLLHSVYNCGYSIDIPKTNAVISEPALTVEQNKNMLKLGGNNAVVSNTDEPFVYFLQNHSIVCKAIKEDVKVNQYIHPFTVATGTLFESYSSQAISSKYLLAGSSKGFIYMYNSKSGKHLKTLNLHEETVNAIAISKDEKYFVSSSNNEIALWDMKQLKPILWYRSMSQAISCFDLSADGKKIISGTSNGELKFWNMETNEIKQGEVQLSAAKRSAGISVYINEVKYVNDSIVDLDIVFGEQEGITFKKATTFKGRWELNTNSISLTPIKQYTSFDVPYQIINSSLSVYAEKQKSTVTANGSSLNWFINGNPFEIKKAHEDKITCIKIDQENNILYSSCADGSLKTWDLSSGLPLLTMLSYKSNYLYVTPENYYYASKGGLKNVGFKKGLSVYPFEQFDLQYNHPEKIIAKLPFFDEQQQALYASAYKKRIKRLGVNETQVISDFKNVPQILITSKDVSSTKKAMYTLAFTAIDSTTKIKSVTVLINGTNVAQRNYSNLNTIEDSLEIELSSGVNFIQVYAINSKGLSSVKEDITVTKSNNKKPSLYMLVIGADKFEQSIYNLKYPSKDAKDFAKVYVKNKHYESVEVKNISGSDVTKTAIVNAIKAWTTMKVNDELVLFYAGHGLLDKNLNYFLSTYDINFNSPEEKGLAYDTLIAMLEKIPARNKIVYIDACHSGEVDKEDLVKSNETAIKEEGLVFRSVTGGVKAKENAVGLKNSLEVSKILFADLRQNNGVTVISSAGGAEYAIEGDKWNNGVFTYCLLSGLKSNKSDLNKDGKVFMDELQQYLMVEVKRISNGLQVPTSRSENIYNNIQIK